MFLLKFFRSSNKSSFLKYRPSKILHLFTNHYNDIAFEDIPEVSTALIRKVLKLQNVSFEEGHTCFVAPCRICSKSKTNAKLYINKTTGMYMCNACKQHGQWDQFEAILNYKKGKRTKTKDIVTDFTQHLEKMKESLDNIKNSTSEIRMVEENTFDDIISKFKLPKVSKKVMDDTRINSQRSILYFPLKNSELEIVGFRTISSYLKDENVIPNMECGGLLTWESPRKSDTVVLVPNISDFLILADSKINFNVVCLPNSINNLPQHVLPALEKYEKVILWTGSDNRSWDCARNFAKKLNDKRCFLIRPNEILPHLEPQKDFKSILVNARAVWHKSITTFTQLRADVLSELQNIDKIDGVRFKKFPTLNKILKGHRRGELTVFTGPTGSGKTTFISEYSLDLAMQGVNTLWGSFEIRNSRLMRTMLQQYAGLPLQHHLQQFDALADQFERLPIYFMTFHGQQPIRVVMEAIEHAAYVHDIAHVIIDNLQFMMGLTEAEQRHVDRFWKQDAVVAAFRAFATRKHCHVTLVIHPRKERPDEDLTTSSIFGGAKATQEADNVLIIQDKRLASLRGKKYLQVAKNRYSGDLGVMALDFDKSSLSFAPKKRKLADDSSKETNKPIVT